MAEDRAHSPLGASKAERWINCPGSVRLTAALPEPPPSKFADEGTRAHTMAEGWLKHVRQLAPHFRLTDWPTDMREHVSHYVYGINDAVRDCGGGEEVIEQRFRLDAIGPDMYGTTDYTLYGADGTLWVWDLKYGAGVPVHVEHNPQLLYYAWGAYLARPDFQPERIRMTVVQPRLPVGDEIIRTWECDLVTFMEFGAQLKIAAEATKAPDAPLQGGKWCRWCPAAPSCPFLLGEVQWVEENFAPSVPNKHEFVLVSEPGALRDLYDRASRLEVWIKALRAHAMTSATRGTPPAGMKLVEKRATRAWIDGDVNEIAEMICAAVPALSREEVTESRLLSPAAIQKRVGKGQMDRLEALITRQSSGHTLALESDPRAAVSLDAATDFNDVNISTED